MTIFNILLARRIVTYNVLEISRYFYYFSYYISLQNENATQKLSKCMYINNSTIDKMEYPIKLENDKLDI